MEGRTDGFGKKRAELRRSHLLDHITKTGESQGRKHHQHSIVISIRARRARTGGIDTVPKGGRQDGNQAGKATHPPTHRARELSSIRIPRPGGRPVQVIYRKSRTPFPPTAPPSPALPTYLGTSPGRTAAPSAGPKLRLSLGIVEPYPRLGGGSGMLLGYQGPGRNWPLGPGLATYAHPGQVGTRRSQERPPVRPNLRLLSYVQVRQGSGEGGC